MTRNKSCVKRNKFLEREKLKNCLQREWSFKLFSFAQVASNSLSIWDLEQASKTQISQGSQMSDTDK